MHIYRPFILASILALFAVTNPFALIGASSFHYGSLPCELTLSQVSERTLRIELTPLDDKGQPMAGAPSTVLVPFPTKEKLRIRQLDSPQHLRIGSLRVALKPNPLTISVHRTDGRLVQELVFTENDGPKPGSAGFLAGESLSFRTDSTVLGLGEGEQQFDRREHNYRMRNGQLSPLLATQGATIPVPFLIGTDGWALFIHRPWGEFDLRGSHGQFLPSQYPDEPPTRNRATLPEGHEPLDLFLIAWDEPADALAEFIRLTGHSVMPPKWTLGYFQSHRTLLGPDDALQIARTFREKHLPCDALIYLGTGYCTNGWNTGHGSLEFNPNAFNHPAAQIQALHDLNFKMVLHINHAPRDLFGTTFEPLTHHASRITEDFSSPLHIRNYWARHREDFALGVDGWWPDDGDELPIEARLARHRCYYDGPLLDRPNVRPWSLHRNGFAGVARYGGWIWSGDTMSRWSTLAAHVPVALNYSLSVTPFWGSDTGGFVATSELTGELYTRWFQFSAFNPLFRSHGRTWHLRLPWGWDTGEYGPIETQGRPDPSELHNAAVEPICRKYLELRYQLLPYNYTLMREACDTGLPPMRALWLHYPHDPEAVKLGDEYLWGRDILVAPVVEKGAKTRRYYLPTGDWYDWWTGEKLDGSRWIERLVDLAYMPIYVRAGAIIPLDPIRQYTAQPADGPTVLKVFPGADGQFTLYDDDGQSLDYLKSTDLKSVWIQFKWNEGARALTIEPDKRMKTWSAGSRRFSVQVAGSAIEPAPVEFNGKRTVVKL